MIYFDSHAHLTCETLLPDVDALVDRASEAGVNHVVNICTDRPSLQAGLELHQRKPHILNAGATTPHDVERLGEADFPAFEQAAKAGDLVAVGESGLDYYYEHSDRKLQQAFLRRYLNLARECNVPIIIHCRDAFADLFSILDEVYREGGKTLPGLLHCFTGTIAEAEEVVARGWMLSLSGIVTFKRSEELREVAKMVPLDQLLIETDAPYLAPQGRRGKTNEPSYLPLTAQVIADQRGMTIAELAEATTQNALRFFRV